MARKRLKPTLALVERIISYIRAGSYPLEAAESAGVPAAVFRCWMAQSWRQRRGPLSLLRPAVFEALAISRIVAEAQVFRDEPLAWLKHGPGKETADRPGWSALARANSPQDDRPADDLLNPVLQAYFAAILQALAPYPEARAAVAATLADKQPDSSE
jgi:hypothetical protein